MKKNLYKSFKKMLIKNKINKNEDLNVNVVKFSHIKIKHKIYKNEI